MTLLRSLYRVLLRLHPADFRHRFGDEMLDIFDSSGRNGDTTYLLFDAARSLVIQHARPGFNEQKATAFCLEVQTSSLTVARMSQAAALAGALLFLLSSLIVREMPPISASDERPACRESDGHRLQAKMEIRR